MYDVMNLPEMQKRIRGFHRNQYFRTCTTVVQTGRTFDQTVALLLLGLSAALLLDQLKVLKSFGSLEAQLLSLCRRSFHQRLLYLSRSGLSFFHRIHGSLVPQNVQTHSIDDRRLTRFRCWEGIRRRQVRYRKCPPPRRNYSSILGLEKKVPCNDHEDQFRADDTSEEVLGPRT